MAMKKLFLGAAVMSLLASASQATVDIDCAVVLKTPDGFLALRKGPGTQFKMITKLQQGDFLVFSAEDDGKSKWVEAEARNCMGCETFARGWVYRKYAQSFVCHAEKVLEPGK
jgi:hypothetical protein